MTHSYQVDYFSVNPASLIGGIAFAFRHPKRRVAKAKEPVDPKLAAEVTDYFTNDQFRHGTKIVRWRKDKAPSQCTLDQGAGREGKSLALL